MRHELFAATVLAAAVASSASAQDGPDRRFTKARIDPNRNDRIVYVPIGRSFREPRPATQPYDVAAATWYLQPLGAKDVRASDTLEKAEYRLENMEMDRGSVENGGMIRVVITRSPAPLTDTAAPQLRVVHPDTLISSRAMGKVETTADGARYTFLVRPPHFGLAGSSGTQAQTPRFELQFLPERDVPTPRSIARAPGFGGADLETRMQQAPPNSRVEQRVAGKRQEFRSR